MLLTGLVFAQTLYLLLYPTLYPILYLTHWLAEDDRSWSLGWSCGCPTEPLVNGRQGQTVIAGKDIFYILHIG